jgi:hypothetical protein
VLTAEDDRCERLRESENRILREGEKAEERVESERVRESERENVRLCARMQIKKKNCSIFGRRPRMCPCECDVSDWSVMVMAMLVLDGVGGG